MKKKLSNIVAFLAISNTLLILNWVMIIKAAPLSGQDILGFEISIVGQILFGVFVYSMWSKRAQFKEEGQIVMASQVAEACGD